MYAYVAPVSDYAFLLGEVLGFDCVMEEMGRKEIDKDLACAVLEEAGRFCSQRLQPLNREGDEHGASLVKGDVVTPPGFADAWRDFVSGGWPSLSGQPEWGGQGLPFILQVWLDEMASATNVAFGLFAGLTRGACEALAEHASDELKTTYLRRMISGEWTGAMALTESAAGTDLGLLRTRAELTDDGSYNLTGTKIFISSADHDFGGNIIHLVLARLPDAPSGVKGISLFLVPKYLPDNVGAFTVRNSMHVGAIEKKMGIHAQPTCVMNYDGAKGWLVGAPNRGLAAMFTMMNAERLMVGVQGLGLAGGAYQQAVHYAKERVQGRSIDGLRGPVPIIEHGDVRRMLLMVRSFVEAGRALAGWTALQLEKSFRHPEAKLRAKSADLVSLLTPVIKASFSDYGFESAVLAQQVFGGHGYIREWGMEQFVRDARITQIYEGTNGIQAMDLVGRKLKLGNGTVVADFLDLMTFEIEEARAKAGLWDVALRTLDAITTLRKATSAVLNAGSEQLGGVAHDYLKLFALVSFGWIWTKMGVAGSASNSPLHLSKVKTAKWFAAKMLPQVEALSKAIEISVQADVALGPDEF